MLRFHAESGGVRIGLDDFGTGYASLTHRKQFPLDRINFGRRLVQNLEQVSDDKAVIAAVIGLGRNLQLQVTAKEWMRMAKPAPARTGLRLRQDFLYGEPMAASEIPDLLKRRGKMLVGPHPTGTRSCRASGVL